MPWQYLTSQEKKIRVFVALKSTCSSEFGYGNIIRAKICRSQFYESINRILLFNLLINSINRILLLIYDLCSNENIKFWNICEHVFLKILISIMIYQMYRLKINAQSYNFVRIFLMFL